VKTRSDTKPAALNRRSRSEAAAAEMHTASAVMAPAEMHAATVTAAEMHAAAVATSAKMTATAMATTAMTAAHLRGQTLRHLLGHARITRIDQRHRLRRPGADCRHHEQRGGSKPKADQATP